MKHTKAIAQRYLLTASLALAAAGVVAACGDDDKPGNEPDASAGGAGGKATGGTGGGGGKATGGTANTGGGKATGGSVGEPDASTDGGDVPDGSTGPGPNHPTVVIAVVTDYATSALFTTIDLVQHKVLGTHTFSDNDTVPVVSDGKAFAVSRTAGIVYPLTDAGAPAKEIALTSPDGGVKLNPYGVVVVPGTSKAFVPLYDASAVAVLDLATGKDVAHVDVSEFESAADHDGSADIGGGVYDAKRNRVYFVAQRIGQFSGTMATNYVPICTGDKSFLFALDATSNALVDLNGAADGSALPLSLVDPTEVTLDAAADRLVLLSAGCAEIADGAGYRSRHGVETVDLAANQTTVRYAETRNVTLADLLILEPNRAIIDSRDEDYAPTFYDYAFGATLGATRTGVPLSAVVATPNALLGLAKGGNADGGLQFSVVGYDVTTKAVASLADFEVPAELMNINGFVAVK